MVERVRGTGGVDCVGLARGGEGGRGGGDHQRVGNQSLRDLLLEVGGVTVVVGWLDFRVDGWEGGRSEWED